MNSLLALLQITEIIIRWIRTAMLKFHILASVILLIIAIKGFGQTVNITQLILTAYVTFWIYKQHKRNRESKQKATSIETRNLIQILHDNRTKD